MFNVFKKRNKTVDQTVRKPKTVLCIPGNWKDRDEILTAIATLRI